MYLFEPYMFDVQGADPASRDPMSEYLAGLERVHGLTQKIGGNGSDNGGGLNAIVVEMMKAQLQSANQMTNMLMSMLLKDNGKKGSDNELQNFLTTMQTLKELDLIGDGKGLTGPDLLARAIDKGGDVLKEVAPQLAERLGINPVDGDMDLEGVALPEVPQIKPAGQLSGGTAVTSPAAGEKKQIRPIG